MISIIWHSRKGKNIKTVKISAVARRGIRGGMEKWIDEWSAGDFRTLKQLSMIQWWRKPTEWTTKRMKFNENYGLQLIIICQYWFIICNKQTTLMQDDNNRGNWRDWVKRSMRIVYFMFNFSINLKTAF